MEVIMKKERSSKGETERCLGLFSDLDECKTKIAQYLLGEIKFRCEENGGFTVVSVGGWEVERGTETKTCSIKIGDTDYIFNVYTVDSV